MGNSSEKRGQLRGNSQLFQFLKSGKAAKCRRRSLTPVSASLPAPCLSSRHHRAAHGEKRRKRCRSRLKAELAPRRPGPRYSTLPPITPFPVLMEKLFSTAFPKTLLFYCIITGLVRVKPCLFSGTSRFSLVLGMRLTAHFCA